VTGLHLRWTQGDATAVEPLILLVHQDSTGLPGVAWRGSVRGTVSRRQHSPTRPTSDLYGRSFEQFIGMELRAHTTSV